MENEALARRLKAINRLISFNYGSLWNVGENIWKAKLVAKGYDLASDRVSHPGICVQGASGREHLHSVIPMLFGTSGKMTPAYQVINFFNDPRETEHITYFGSYFGAVPIEVEKLRPRQVLDSDFTEVRKTLSRQEKARQRILQKKRNEALKNIVRANDKRKQLNAGETAELRNFMRRYLSIA